LKRRAAAIADGHKLPLTYALADTFPVDDRWFCSALAQTDRQRRFLIAAAFGGVTDDLGAGSARTIALASALLGIVAVKGAIFQGSWSYKGLGPRCSPRGLTRCWASV
jgi:hypothetical protein